MKAFQILALIFGLVVLTNAQKPVLSGTVYDASGAVVPGAKVTAIGEKGERFEAETNDEGVYILNLPFNLYDSKSVSSDFRIAKYEIIVDLTNRGFEKFVLKDFKFVPSYKGKMNLDIALDTDNSNCGAGGCLPPEPPVESNKREVSGSILTRVLEELPKKQNTSKLCGTLFDAARALIPGAMIIAKSYKKGIFKTTADAEGNFEMEIPDGLYKIIIKQSGFKKVVMKKQSLPYEPRSCRNYILKSTVKEHPIT